MTTSWIIVGHCMCLLGWIATLLFIGNVVVTDLRGSASYTDHYVNATLHDVPRMLRTTDSGGLEVVGHTLVNESQRIVYDVLTNNATNNYHAWFNRLVIRQEMNILSPSVAFWRGFGCAAITVVWLYWIDIYYRYIIRLAKEEEERIKYDETQAALIHEATLRSPEIHRFTTNGITSPLASTTQSSLPSTSYLDTTIRSSPLVPSLTIPRNEPATSMERLSAAAERHLKKRPKTNGARILGNRALVPSIPIADDAHGVGNEDGNPFLTDADHLDDE